MPPFQVIDRQEDPSARLAIETSNSIANNIRQKQAAKMALLEMQVKIKMADSEQKKALLERNKNIFETAIKMKEQGFDGGMIMKGLSSLYGADTFQALAEGGNSMNEFAKNVGDSPGTGERELRGAQTSKAQAEAGTQNRVNAMLDQQMGGGGDGSGNTARGMVLSGINGTSPQLTNLDADQQKIIAEERAKSTVRAEPFMKQYAVMKNQFMEGLNELPPISDKPGQAKLDGFINGIKAEYGNKSMPGVQAVNRSLDGIALTVANIANGGGRATSDQDRKAIRETLPDYGMPRATMSRLFQYIEAGFPTLNSYSNLPDKDRAKQLKSFMQQGVSTVVEADRTRAKRIKDKFPSATDADVEAALEAIHQKEGAF